MLCLASLVLLASWASAAETDADAASATFAPPSSAATSDGQTSDSSVKRAVEMTTAAYDSTTRSDADWSAELFESAEATSASTRPSPTPETTAPLPSTGAGAPVKSPSSWPWLVFVLSGNATVAGRRQRDLGTYLRLNLAARLDADYNDVAINRILLSAHSVLANISVEPSHLAAGKGLEALGRGNVTLLELSGAEFQVERIIRSDEALDQRSVSVALSPFVERGARQRAAQSSAIHRRLPLHLICMRGRLDSAPFEFHRAS